LLDTRLRLADDRAVIRSFAFASLALQALCAVACASGGLPAGTSKASEKVTIDAAPARGDFRWTVGDDAHVLRSGRVTLGAGGRLQFALADREAPHACGDDLANLPPTEGPARLTLQIPRGLDVEWPIRRPVSPETLELFPHSGERATFRVRRYAIEIDAIELRPGGRVTGRLTFISAPRATAEGTRPRSFGEGRFDLPLCASASEIAALSSLPKPRKFDPSGPVKGRTESGGFLAARVFADLVRAPGLPAHVARLELHADPFVACETRATAKGTSLIVEIDLETGLGGRVGVRQPVGPVHCAAGKLSWECFGSEPSVRGFVEIRASDLRPGGRLTGALAIDGAGAQISGLFDAELCAP
jgi:hypothetical protein